MSRTPILLFFFLCFACHSSSQKEKIQFQQLDFGSFRLKAPKDWYIVKQQGTDSYAGGLTNGKDSLWFDYGSYDVTFDDDNTHQRYARDTVNGLIADIQIPESAGQGYIIMRIPKVIQQNKFTIWGNHINSTDTVLQIFKSVVFKNSDTSNNPPLILSKFTFPPASSGKTLFYSNCAHCHQLYRVLTGPALDTIIDKRSTDWIHTFLTNRSAIYKDPTYSRPIDETICPTFTGQTKNETDMIIEYLKMMQQPAY
ncbi:MAG: cytochrome c [Filimonas sp.]|nr:cytochrome c [Filimonas sp.]